MGTVVVHIWTKAVTTTCENDFVKQKVYQKLILFIFNIIKRKDGELRPGDQNSNRRRY